jgi:ADP-ribose pyrophosphatase YjhB (NUDIX family)
MVLGLLFRRPLPGVVIIALLSNGRIVLARRRDTQTWSLPGGLIDWGETVVEAAQRELREETGLVVTRIPGLLGVYSSLDRDPRMHSICSVIIADVEGGYQINDPDEITEIQDFDIQEAEHLILAHDHQQHLSDFLAEKGIPYLR